MPRAGLNDCKLCLQAGVNSCSIPTSCNAAMSRPASCACVRSNRRAACGASRHIPARKLCVRSNRRAACGASRRIPARKRCLRAFEPARRMRRKPPYPGPQAVLAGVRTGASHAAQAAMSRPASCACVRTGAPHAAQAAGSHPPEPRNLPRSVLTQWVSESNGWKVKRIMVLWAMTSGQLRFLG